MNINTLKEYFGDEDTPTIFTDTKLGLQDDLYIDDIDLNMTFTNDNEDVINKTKLLVACGIPFVLSVTYFTDDISKVIIFDGKEYIYDEYTCILCDSVEYQYTKEYKTLMKAHDIDPYKLKQYKLMQCI